MTHAGVALWLPSAGPSAARPPDALAGHGLLVLSAEPATGSGSWRDRLVAAREAVRRARTRAGHRPLFLAGEADGALLALQLGLGGVTGVGAVAGVLAFWPSADRIPAAPQVGNHVPVLLVHPGRPAGRPVSATVPLAAALILAGHPVHALVLDDTEAARDPRHPDVQALVGSFLGPALASQPTGRPAGASRHRGHRATGPFGLRLVRADRSGSGGPAAPDDGVDSSAS